MRKVSGAIVMIMVCGGLLHGRWAWAEPAAAAPLHVAFLDVSRVFDDYQRTKDAEKQLEGKGKQKEGERQRLVDEVKKLREGFDVLNDDAKAKRQEAIESKLSSLREFETAAKRELQRERDGVGREILKEIDQVVQAYAKEHGYDLVLTQAAVVYAAGAYDITDEVLAALNQRYKPPAAQHP